MADAIDKKPDQGNPLLFYMIVGVIVLAFVAFFLLHPKSSTSGGDTHQTQAAPVAKH